MSLKKYLRKVRIDQELTVKQFAEIMGIAHASYLQMEQMRTKPGKDFVEKFILNFPKYKEDESELSTLVSDSIDNIEWYHKVSGHAYPLMKKIAKLPKDKREHIYNKIVKIIEEV